MKYIYTLLISCLLFGCASNSFDSEQEIQDKMFEHLTNMNDISYDDYLSSFLTAEEFLEILGEDSKVGKQILKKIEADKYNTSFNLDKDFYDNLREGVENLKKKNVTFKLMGFKTKKKEKVDEIQIHKGLLSIDLIKENGKRINQNTKLVSSFIQNGDEFYLIGYTSRKPYVDNDQE